MKTWMFLTKYVVLWVLVGTQWSWALPVDSSFKEIPFDDVVRELNSKISKQQKVYDEVGYQDPYDNLKIQLSLGVVQSMAPMALEPLQNESLKSGMQLGVGIDLFSPHWMAEGLIKNFGQIQTDQISYSLREFDLRLNYHRSAPDSKFIFRISNGLGSRNLHVANKLNQISNSYTSPVYLLGVGGLVPMGSLFHLDFEVQAHKSLIDDPWENEGLTLMLRLVKMI